MHRLSHAIILVVMMAASAVCQEPNDLWKDFEIGEAEGWVILPDQITLVVSVPEQGKLLYFDTLLGRQSRMIEMEFKPKCLAYQKGFLYASAKGTSTIYVLDAKTAQVQRQFDIGGEPIRNLACHPEKGLLYSCNLTDQVHAIYPTTGRAIPTKAVATVLAVDPVKAEYLYTGTNKPSKEYIEVVRNGRRARIQFVTETERAAVRKYRIRGSKLQLIGGNPNASIGAGGKLHISPDGSKYAYVSGGGWSSTKDKRFRYVVALFKTDDMLTSVGHIETGAYPQDVALHPLLDLGVASKSDGTLKLFKAKSLAGRGKIETDERRGNHPRFNILTFGGAGTQIVYFRNGKLRILPIELEAAERELLATKMKAASGKKSSNSQTKKSKRRASASLKLVTITRDVGEMEFVTLNEDGKYLTDYDYQITSFPKEMDGAAMLVRSRQGAQFYLQHDKNLRVNRRCTLYMAVKVARGNFVDVPDLKFAAFMRQGWKEVTETFLTSEEEGSSKWRVVKRTVPPGQLKSLFSKVHLRSERFVYFFK